MASNFITEDHDDVLNEDVDSKSVLDLAYLDQDDDTLNVNVESYAVLGRMHESTKIFLAHHNRLRNFPSALLPFQQLTFLDISSNQLSDIPDDILYLSNLVTFVVKHNNLHDDSLPKHFSSLEGLRHLNLSGNDFTMIPRQVLEMTELKTLHLGSNKLISVSSSVSDLQCLEVLYLGGNQLTEITEDVGYLSSLQALYLCENKLDSLPNSIAKLRRLKSLALHKNRLKTLPPEIVRLRELTELSLRDNPLVVNFVRDMACDPPSLLELSARTIKTKNVRYQQDQLPRTLISYLSTAERCVNPKCKGVYFDNRVENIKFVDFCGKYHVPLLQYLCSSSCYKSPAILQTSSDSSETEDEYDIPSSRMKKVLLG